MRKCPKCGREFGPPTRICPDDQTPLRDTVSQEEQPIGRTLDGKYRIDGFLKRGGMGAVYRGTHLLLNKGVAIKLIRPEIVTSTEMVERFFREARAAAKLSHPNIVTVHDLGQTEDGTLYIIMELVEGRSLKELIQKEGPMTPERAMALAKGVASALSLAHKNDIVHRDLKPQNIMVTLDADGAETPKLLDFGIAKTLEPDTPALTSTGMVLGTPHYMSSEQAKGKPADRRSDLYALGIIMYEMLVGKVPFDDDSIPSILVKHLNETPKPPSTLRAGIPVPVEALVLRCLEKEPDKRFQSATELIQAIDAPPAPRPGATGENISPLPLEPTIADTRVTPPPPAPPAPPGPPPPVTPDPPSQHTMAGASAVASSAPFDSASGTVRAHEVQTKSRSGSRSGLIALVLIALFLLGGAAAAFFVVRTLVNRVTGAPEPAAGPLVAARDTETEIAEGAPSSASASEPTPTAGADNPAPSEPGTEAGAGATPLSVSNPSTATSTSETQPPPAAATPAPAARPQPRPTPTPTQTPARSAEPEPEPEPIPENPTFSIDCRGVRDACGAMRTVLRDALVRKGMAPARPIRAELLITLDVEEVESRTEQQFGTTFVVRTYSVSGDTEVPRFDDVVVLPDHTFSFDVRFGRDKLREQARVISNDIATELTRYWDGQSR